MAKPITIPQAPGALPLLGHSVQLLRNPVRFLSSLPGAQGLVQIRIGPMKAVVVRDHELTRQVLLDDRAYDKGGPFFDRLREIMGNGLGTCGHDEHRRQRRMIQPAFHISRMPGYARIMNEQIEAVVGSWRGDRLVNVYEEMVTLATRVAVASMFSGTLSAQILKNTMEDFTTIVRTMYKRMIMPPPLDKLPTPDKRRYDRARARARRTIYDVIADRRRSTETDHGDLLSVLLTARDAEGQALSEAEIHDHLVTFYLAGVMTTASSLSWTLHLLAQHPDVQRRLQAEVDEVLGGARATFEDLRRLELAGRIVSESLRQWPPGWFVTRVTTSETRLDGHHIPAGTTVIYSPYLVHHRSDLYSDPYSFDPDRWLPERAAAVPRSAHIPFGDGARKCIADNFSLVQSTLVIAAVAGKWRLEAASAAEVRPVYGAVLSPRHLKLRVVTRPPAPVPGPRRAESAEAPRSRAVKE